MNAIVSVTREWGIGKDGSLIVPNRADMRRFVQLTRGCTVVMGRATYQSLPGGPLKGRRNVVLTRAVDFPAEGIELAHSVEECRSLLAGEDEERVWLIGGAQLYRTLLGSCRRAYVTKNDVSAEADAFFPDLDADPDWLLVGSDGGGRTDEGVAYEFLTYENKAYACGSGLA